jgi:hypothetical protein
MINQPRKKLPPSDVDCGSPAAAFPPSCAFTYNLKLMTYNFRRPLPPLPRTLLRPAYQSSGIAGRVTLI